MSDTVQIREGWEFSMYADVSHFYWEPPGEDDDPGTPCVVVTGATADEVKAGLYWLRNPYIRVYFASREWHAWGEIDYGKAALGSGSSPAEAMLALIDKVGDA